MTGPMVPVYLVMTRWTAPVGPAMTDDGGVPVDFVMTDDHRFGHGSTVSPGGSTTRSVHMLFAAYINVIYWAIQNM